MCTEIVMDLLEEVRQDVKDIKAEMSGHLQRCAQETAHNDHLRDDMRKLKEDVSSLKWCRNFLYAVLLVGTGLFGWLVGLDRMRFILLGPPLPPGL